MEADPVGVIEGRAEDSRAEGEEDKERASKGTDAVALVIMAKYDTQDLSNYNAVRGVARRRILVDDVREGVWVQREEDNQVIQS